MEFGNIKFSCESQISPDRICNFLPNWKTKILHVDPLKNSIKLAIAAKTKDQIQEWLQLFETKNKARYSVHSTPSVKGELVVFKQLLNCQHNTRSTSLYNGPKMKGKMTKNTNCPSSIRITLRAIKKRGYRGKNPALAPDPELPCEIEVKFVHNHLRESADALRFRRVSKDVEEKLISLFKAGHKPSSALQCIKMEICLKYPDEWGSMLDDRSCAPDYDYCWHLYRKFRNKQFEMTNFENDWEKTLFEKIQAFRDQGERNIEIILNENGFRCTLSDMDLQNDPNENVESLRDENCAMIELISLKLKTFAQDSPLEMNAALKSMVNNMKRLKTSAACVSACTTFAKGEKVSVQLRRQNGNQSDDPRRQRKKKENGKLVD